MLDAGIDERREVFVEALQECGEEHIVAVKWCQLFLLLLPDHPVEPAIAKAFASQLA